METFNRTKLVALIMGLWVYFAASAAKADNGSKVIVNSKCETLTMGMIPVGDFTPPVQLPEDNLHIKQRYNTAYADGYEVNGTWYYGHDGLDIDGSSQSPGVNDVKAIFPGIVILSLDEKATGGKFGWGETIIIATRTNEYSEEILTHHYHHMYADDGETSRKFNACELVQSSDILGKEDNTGNSHGSHLHVTTRRWKNLDELLAALKMGKSAIFGHGYTFGDNSKIAKHLDPEGLLFDTYRDYKLDSNNNPPSYYWSLPYVLDLRHRGIEFGLFDGRFGAGETVKRREAARWIKIAAQRLNATPVSSTFTDIPATDSDYPYIEALTGYPSAYPVINKNANISNGQKYFYPDQEISRAAALKMVILGFYSAEFLDVYNNYIWKAEKAAASQLFSQFQDVHPSDWFAPFVYFGAQKGLVTTQAYFNPFNTVKREEMAKWISEGAAQIQAETSGPCNFLLCPQDYFCEPATAQCYAIPTCIPSENQVCEVGGGNTNNGSAGTSGSTGSGGSGGVNNSGGSSGNAGSYDPCGGYCGPGTVCNYSNGMCELANNGTAGNGGNMGAGGTSSGGSGGANSGSSGNAGSNGAGGISAVCTPGESQQKPCNSGTGVQTRICNSSGQWDNWSACVPNGVCSAGQSVACTNCGTMTCDQNGQWGGCLNQGECSIAQTQAQNCPGSGTQTRTCNNSCMWGPWSGCPSQCQEVFLASDAKSCYTVSGGPTFCIYVQQVSGANWNYKVCKDGGSFVNNYKVVLHDDNHTPQLGDTYNGNAGDVCAPWRSFSVSYINGNGPMYGAGLRAEIISPSSCSQSSCTYSSGIITIRKECQ